MPKNDRFSLINKANEYGNEPFVYLKLGSKIAKNQDKKKKRKKTSWLISMHLMLSRFEWHIHSLRWHNALKIQWTRFAIAFSISPIHATDGMCVYVHWFEWFAQYECHELNSLSTCNLLSIIHILWCNAVYIHGVGTGVQIGWTIDVA